jgi:hypothetical protein
MVAFGSFDVSGEEMSWTRFFSPVIVLHLLWRLSLSIAPKLVKGQDVQVRRLRAVNWLH